MNITNRYTRVLLRLSLLSIGLCVHSMAYAAPVDLFVGNFFGHDSDVLKYNGTTGAFESLFVPFSVDSFPLGAAFGADGNFYLSNSDTDAVLKINGATGALISTPASSRDRSALVRPRVATRRRSVIRSKWHPLLDCVMPARIGCDAW